MNNDLTKYLSDKEAKYINDSWKSFTALTEAEEENLKKIISSIKPYKKKLCTNCTVINNKKIISKPQKIYRKKVMCIETGEIFESISSAAEYLGVRQSHISNCIKYGWKVKHQYSFKFTEKQQEKKKILWITLQ